MLVALPVDIHLLCAFQTSTAVRRGGYQVLHVDCSSVTISGVKPIAASHLQIDSGLGGLVATVPSVQVSNIFQRSASC